MSRWHDASCSNPDIAVSDGVPSCRACGATPEVDAIITEQAAFRTPWDAPPDEPPGQLNLWWPPTVRYADHEGASAGSADGPTASDDSDSNSLGGSGEQAKTAAVAASKPPWSPIYNPQLSADQFRVIHLIAAKDYNSPVHVDLEICEDDCYPEYEATSYAWGGEDGDYSLSVPVYIGSSWDVLAVTKNCASMLQHLRARRDAQYVWIDAICINQRDDVERTMQVVKMHRIYQLCRRVILYLGPDVVTPLEGKFARRKDLLDFDKLQAASGSGTALSEILLRRYFSRVWVVQEIVLAPSVVIPIYGVDFYVTEQHWQAESASEDSSAAIDPWQTAKTGPGWLKHAGGGIESVNADALRKLLELTRHCQASDPRDLVLGTLGIKRSDSRSAISTLEANYSLSLMHVAIGSMAQIILNERGACFLTLAGISRHDAGKNYPSWSWDLRALAEDRRRIPNCAGRSSEWKLLDATRLDLNRYRQVNIVQHKHMLQWIGQNDYNRWKNRADKGIVDEVSWLRADASMEAGFEAKPGYVNRQTGSLTIHSLHLANLDLSRGQQISLREYKAGYTEMAVQTSNGALLLSVSSQDIKHFQSVLPSDDVVLELHILESSQKEPADGRSEACRLLLGLDRVKAPATRRVRFCCHLYGLTLLVTREHAATLMAHRPRSEHRLTIYQDDWFDRHWGAIPADDRYNKGLQTLVYTTRSRSDILGFPLMKIFLFGNLGQDQSYAVIHLIQALLDANTVNSAGLQDVYSGYMQSVQSPRRVEFHGEYIIWHGPYHHNLLTELWVCYWMYRYAIENADRYTVDPNYEFAKGWSCSVTDSRKLGWTKWTTVEDMILQIDKREGKFKDLEMYKPGSADGLSFRAKWKDVIEIVRRSHLVNKLRLLSKDRLLETYVDSPRAARFWRHVMSTYMLYDFTGLGLDEMGLVGTRGPIELV